MTGDSLERFEEHPTPDRFFQQIGDVEIEMEPMDSDGVKFSTQHVPGGGFGVEIGFRYSYAGYECAQLAMLDRDGAEALYERLGEILDKDQRGNRR